MSDVFDKKEWIDRQSQFPTRRRLTNVDTSEEMVVDVVREEGTVDVAGHPFNAAGMNDLEDRIDEAIDTLQSNFQDGVDSIYDACVDKGSTPTSHALADVVEAIENISTGSVINIFGTPASDTPQNGNITTAYNIYIDHYAYKAFGDNEDGWVSNNTDIANADTVMYEFTDDSEYIPTEIQFCSKFVIFGGETISARTVGVMGYNGTDWVMLGEGYSTEVDEIVKISLEVNEYYSKFRFGVVGNTGVHTGLKNIKCYGIKKEAGGGGKDTIRPIIWGRVV